MAFSDTAARPGHVARRGEVAAPAGYAVIDCETTGTEPGRDEIVSIALVRLDAEGREVARFSSLVRPSRPIPAEATAVHGIGDADVAAAPRFVELVPELLPLLDGAVFAAHNAAFDLAMVRQALAAVGIDYRPPGVACTLEAFRLVEPLAAAHNLEALCRRHGIPLAGAHEALGDVLATVALLRLLLGEGLAPETVRLDSGALWRLRSRGDTRPASERQIRRVFALGHAAGLDRDGIVALVARAAGTGDVDALTREQVQDVYDALATLPRAA